jgi:hypothetical protein
MQEEEVTVDPSLLDQAVAVLFSGGPEEEDGGSPAVDEHEDGSLAADEEDDGSAAAEEEEDGSPPADEEGDGRATATRWLPVVVAVGGRGKENDPFGKRDPDYMKNALADLAVIGEKAAAAAQPPSGTQVADVGGDGLHSAKDCNGREDGEVGVVIVG